MTKSPASNTRRPEDRDLGPMWPVTQRLLRRERLRLLYGTKPSGIHSPVNAQSKAKGSQYRHDLQNSESSGTKVTSLI